MNQAIYLSVLVLLLSVNLSTAAIEKFVLHERTTVWGRTVFRIRRPSSAEQCAQTCLAHGKCRAFVYSRVTRYCYGRKQSYPDNRNHWRRSVRYDYYETNDNRYPVQEVLSRRRDFSHRGNSRHAALVNRQPITILRRPDPPLRQIPYHRKQPIPTRSTTSERTTTTTKRPTTTTRTTTTSRPKTTTKATITTKRTRRPQPPKRRPSVPLHTLDKATTKPTTMTTTTRLTRRPITTTMRTTTTTRRPVRTTTEKTTRKIPPTVVPSLSCDQAVGIGTGTIPDGKITASSSYWRFAPSSGRLKSGSGWMASTTNVNEYLEVDFGGPKKIVAVATQGGYYLFSSEFTKTYKLQFLRNPNGKFETYRERGQEKIFDGNTDASKTVKNVLLTPVKAYKIRFLPITFYNNILLKVEAYEAC